MVHVVESSGATVPVHEPEWQALVAPAICDHLGIRPECLHAEVQTRDGSIADFVAVVHRRLIAFELKMAERGEVAIPLNARAQRQLRHYSDSADEVYLVTLCAPRSYNWVDGRVVIREPLEPQLVPDGVGWLAFDHFSRQLTMLRPASNMKPTAVSRAALADKIVARLQRAVREVQGARQCPV